MSDREPVDIADTVRSSTPALRPRQPAWAAAISLPSAAEKRTGRQSAVITTHTTPASLQTMASASAGTCGAGSYEHAGLPWTWRNHAGSLGSRQSAPKRRRFSLTASSSSPTCAPRLSDAYRSVLTPPERSVVPATMPAGAGQSAWIQPHAHGVGPVRMPGQHVRAPAGNPQAHGLSLRSSRPWSDAETRASSACRGLSAESPQYRSHFVAGGGGHGQSSAVHRIAKQGMAPPGEVHP